MKNMGTTFFQHACSGYLSAATGAPPLRCCLSSVLLLPLLLGVATVTLLCLLQTTAIALTLYDYEIDAGTPQSTPAAQQESAPSILPAAAQPIEVVPLPQSPPLVLIAPPSQEPEAPVFMRPRQGVTPLEEDTTPRNPNFLKPPALPGGLTPQERAYIESTDDPLLLMQHPSTPGQPSALEPANQEDVSGTPEQKHPYMEPQTAQPVTPNTVRQGGPAVPVSPSSAILSNQGLHSMEQGAYTLSEVDELLGLINSARIQGIICNDEETAPAPGMILTPELSAYTQSRTRSIGTSDTPVEGDALQESLARSGIVPGASVEMVIRGPRNANEAFAQLARDPNNCNRLMSATFTRMGGGVSAPNALWVITLTGP